jgi:Tat protein translocase TatB subunit
MLNIGTGEILVILLMALLVLGPDKLPGAARTMGKAMREVRRLSNGLQHEMREAMKSADIDLDLPGITTPMAGTATTTAMTNGLHPGLGRGPRLEAGAVVIDGTTAEVTADGQPTETSDVPSAGSTGAPTPVVHTDGPTGSFS